MNISNILEAEKIHEKRKLLEKKERALLAPVLRDTAQIGRMLPPVQRIVRKNKRYREDEYDVKDYFIMSIAMLYSPAVFVGQAMGRGVRAGIAGALGISPVNVSNRLKRIRSWYAYYNDFRETVDEICKVLTEGRGI